MSICKELIRVRTSFGILNFSQMNVKSMRTLPNSEPTFLFESVEVDHDSDDDKYAVIVKVNKESAVELAKAILKEAENGKL